MSDGAPGADRGSDHRGLSKLRIAGPRFARRFYMNIDAVRTLGRQGDGYGDELLALRAEGTLGKCSLIEGPEGVHRGRRMNIEPIETAEIFLFEHRHFLKFYHGFS